MRRFTRLTNGASQKVENLTHAVSLHYRYYNFARPHVLPSIEGRPVAVDMTEPRKDFDPEPKLTHYPMCASRHWGAVRGYRGSFVKIDMP